MNDVEVIRARMLGGVAHGFLGRRGGVSQGLVSGLNVGLGSADDPAAVAANRARAVDAVLPGAALCGLYQTHSASVVRVLTAYGDEQRPEGDALVTDRPDILLGIVTADCAPVLFADVEAGIVGAAHAGWKGALNGITDATIAQMVTLGARPDRIVAAIGPCIARASYEVDLAFAERFCATDPANERFFAENRPGHARFDLEAYVAHRLAMAGVRRVEAMGLDTYGDPDRFFSFRRATHRGEPDYGRQLSVIGLSA
ncbi:peptidoglycan editing factor PgeF [Sphingomonas sp. Leaf4]|uniref:peptidoglycan editing factor PgeF n=1 Tax=Sphingomonas sp. Leaf4 TaxID=2876553 RepID=UPI001E50A0A3|nr:peptidoglycan editing factor PgeF [Sphingomonas sp. Leaf4]